MPGAHDRRLLQARAGVGARIAQIRTARQLTQQDLAARAGTYQTRISKLEAGRLDFRISTLAAVAAALDAAVMIDLAPLAATSAPALPLQTDLEQNLFRTVRYRAGTGTIQAQTFAVGADSVIGRSKR
jgi:transcriptional regulator with XRE-family HTH domain